MPCPPPGDLPDPGIEPMSLASSAWHAGSLPLVTPGKPRLQYKEEEMRDPSDLHDVKSCGLEFGEAKMSLVHKERAGWV